MYLGIDIGTSGVKTILIDQNQQIIASAHCELAVSRPHSGWSEQSPRSWVSATTATLDELKSTHPNELSSVKGLALSGQMHGATLIDKSDKVLRPCMLWNDTRSHAEAAEMDSNPLFREISGNIVFPGFTAPKVEWVKRNEPKIFSQIYKVLLPKDYVRLWLSGDAVSDVSDASGTSWLDIKKRDWSPELLSICSLDIRQMPNLVEGTEVTGQLRKELAQRWGMNKAPIIAGGAGDNAASACGMGTVTKGSAFVSLGTSGVLFTSNDSCRPKPESAVHTFCHAIPNTWHQMGVILSATDSLNWYANIAGKTAAKLTKELGETLQKPTGVTFLPYLAGERTPHNDASIRGSFIGLGHDTDQRAMTQAVLEGVTFALKDNLLAINATGSNIERLTAVGGGSQSIYWLKALATALNVPIDYPVAGDFGGAFGAARLALIAETNATPLDICTPPKTEFTVEPDLKLQSTYDAAYVHFKSLYPAIKGLSV